MMRKAEINYEKTDHNSQDFSCSLSLIVKLIWKLGDEEENFRHTRTGWLSVGGVDVHRELQLDVLRSVERCHEEKRDALLHFVETAKHISL